MGNQGCLAKINRLAPLDKVCILSCGISTGLGATLNVAKPKKGSSVAVFGLGAVGLAGQTPLFPRIFDHEAAGVVESVGDGVKNLKPGDHVLPVFTGECGDCVHCKSEESNMCDLVRINTDRGVMIGDGKQRFSKNGTPINQFLGTSTLNIQSSMKAALPRSIRQHRLGATLNVAKPKKGSSVAVFGLGAVDLAITNGGVGRSLECTGNVNSIISAFECVYDGWGVAVLVGVPSTDAIFKTNPFNFLD
ncbi:hypothetical protein Pyn_20373 [Prunus yedoensis var. nudiflora]|uniref:Alcohol dehydrogenase-like N-terminal domain-containing protein n=1 Tax=Prunus yedoensis var. nudiflora TaxID=2094558 RepID=A0A314Y280_PRUYE|nr:hypothetical protein Pyn_20373 [Prunus yedoensis var. nudiflora]